MNNTFNCSHISSGQVNMSRNDPLLHRARTVLMTLSSSLFTHFRSFFPSEKQILVLQSHQAHWHKPIESQHPACLLHVTESDSRRPSSRTRPSGWPSPGRTISGWCGWLRSPANRRKSLTPGWNMWQHSHPSVSCVTCITHPVNKQWFRDASWCCFSSSICKCVWSVWICARQPESKLLLWWEIL